MGIKIFWAFVFFASAGLTMIVIRLIEVHMYKRGKLNKEKALAFEDKALQVLEAVGLALFTDAENQYGSGTGVLKKAAVLARLWQLMPQDVQDHISVEWLSEKAEYYLELAKEQWAKNGRLVK